MDGREGVPDSTTQPIARIVEDIVEDADNVEVLLMNTSTFVFLTV